LISAPLYESLAHLQLKRLPVLTEETKGAPKDSSKSTP
jgi:hypothetical protein